MYLFYVYVYSKSGGSPIVFLKNNTMSKGNIFCQFVNFFLSVFFLFFLFFQAWTNFCQLCFLASLVFLYSVLNVMVYCQVARSTQCIEMHLLKASVGFLIRDTVMWVVASLFSWGYWWQGRRGRSICIPAPCSNILFAFL